MSDKPLPMSWSPTEGTGTNPVFTGTLDIRPVPHYPDDCRVYWGTHGCRLWRGHKQLHVCDCDGKPYYGRWTRFYGEDRTLFERAWWHIAGWYYWIRHRLRSDL